MTASTVTMVQYDDHTWNVEAGPNAMGYYKITRNDDYPHTVYAHKSHLTFVPEAAEVMEIVTALYTVYLDQNDGDEYAAEGRTRAALVTLGWNSNRAYRAASHVTEARG